MDHSFSRVHYPVPNPPHKPPREHAQALPVGWIIRICGGHGPGETPGPIPNPEAKTWHGDGTAPGRVWESSTPPHPNLTGRGHHSVPPPFFTYPNTTANTPLAPGHARRIPYPDTHDPGTPGSKTARTTRSKIAHVRCSTCLLRAFFLVFKRQRLFFGNLNRLLNLCSESL